MGAIVDVHSTDYHNDLYNRYDTLRRDHPVYFDASRNIWMITRYDDVRRLLRHPEGTQNGDTGHSYIPNLANSDGELHSNIRKTVIGEFSQGVASQFAPVAEKIAEELFDSLPDSGDIDIYAGVILRLPQLFMTHFLGFPDEQAEHWYEIGEVLMGTDPEKEEPSAEQAIRGLDENKLPTKEYPPAG